MVIIILLSFIVSQFIYSTREVTLLNIWKRFYGGLEPMRYPTGKVLLNITIVLATTSDCIVRTAVNKKKPDAFSKMY